MAVIGLFIPFLFIGLIVLFILVTVGNREFIPPIAQYGALSSPILTAVVTIIGVVSVLFGNYVSVDLDIAPLMPSFDIPGTQVVGPAATIVSAVALSATYTVTGVSMTVRTAPALSILMDGAIVAYFSWIIYAIA